MRYSDDRQHGKKYIVTVSIGRHGKAVGEYTIFAPSPAHAKTSAIKEAEKSHDNLVLAAHVRRA